MLQRHFSQNLACVQAFWRSDELMYIIKHFILKVFWHAFSILNTLAVIKSKKQSETKCWRLQSNKVTVPERDHYKTLKNHLCSKHMYVNKCLLSKWSQILKRTTSLFNKNKNPLPQFSPILWINISYLQIVRQKQRPNRQLKAIQWKWARGWHAVKWFIAYLP